MYYRLRDLEEERQFSAALGMDALERYLSPELIEGALLEHGAQTIRHRKLSRELVVLSLVVMGIFRGLSLTGALHKLLREMGDIEGEEAGDVPGTGAIGYQRKCIGSEPLKSLFKAVCQPIATQETVGAFLFGMRMMVIDGHVVDIADTPENEVAYGKHSTNRGKGVYPQIQTVLLCEAGTRAIVDIALLPCDTSEHKGAVKVVDAVKPEMLVMWDRGLFSYELLARTLNKGAHVLCRISSTSKPRLIRKLNDKTSLCSIAPSGRHCKQLREAELWAPGQRLEVRIIEYMVTDPKHGNPGEIQRLLTTLLDETLYPAKQLIAAYHQRWEVETAIREVETVQKLSQEPLRSHLPQNTEQELYALLIGHFIIRSLIHDAAVKANIDPTWISFKGALLLVGESIIRFQMVSGQRRAELIGRLLGDIANQLVPYKPTRHEPRQVKRQTRSSFPLKRQGNPVIPSTSTAYTFSAILI